MKKLYISIFALAVSLNFASAQQFGTPQREVEENGPLTSKNGHAILPVAGEWGLGVSANPFLNYFGDLFNGSNNNNFGGFNYPGSPVGIGILGKYVVDENTFYRARFNVDANQGINKQIVAQNTITPNPQAIAYTEDWQKNNVTNIVLGAGIEKRRGSSRVQGLYGGEVLFGYTSSSTLYQYGNPITSDFNVPNTTNFGGNIVGGGNAREVSRNNGANYRVGARGFIGVEYFIAPKISLGGEFGYELLFQTQTKGTVTVETWGSAEEAVVERVTDVYTGGPSFVGFRRDNLGGAVNLLFYF